MMSDSQVHKKTLQKKMVDRNAIVGIFGLGYVGLPLALCFTDAGFRVIGFDIDPIKIEKLNAGRSYIDRIKDARIKAAIDAGFSATDDFALAESTDALIICVPTPLGERNEPDLSFVVDTIESIAPYLRKGQVVSLESTTYPGTTEEELLPRIQQQDLKVGHDVFLIYSPEREDPGNPDFDTHSIPKVCGGYSENCLEIGQTLYGAALDNVVPVSSLKTAEMTKLLENIYRAVNIGLVNELKMVTDKMGIDIHEVIEAAATKPFGFTPFYPGPGLGGHCIPIDPFYLTWKAREYGVKTEFIELAGIINSNMPEWVVEKAAYALKAKQQSIDGSKILILGIAYKKNVDDLRESPALRLIELLTARGSRVDYCDPHIPAIPKLREYNLKMSSKAYTLETFNSYDLVMIVADHDRFDYSLLEQTSAIVLDTRGVMKNSNATNIIPA